MSELQELIQIKQLQTYFNQHKTNEVRAVDDVSFAIREGETFGLVGESGCGKSTLGRTILQLYQPTSGDVLFEGKSIYKAKKRSDRLYLQKAIQMIFQDPYASLNPHMKVKDIILEGIEIHKLVRTAKEKEARVFELLESVGLNRSHAERYPHEFSGGQRQRIGIARAIAVDPKLIIADEAISALDVSIQAQIVNLLKELQLEKRFTFLFIAHDLSMVRYISDRIGVMFQGKLVEVASAKDLYECPLHRYTASLLSAIPLPDPIEERKRSRTFFNRDDFKQLDHAKYALREITSDHYVYCTEEDVALLQQRKKEQTTK